MIPHPWASAWLALKDVVALLTGFAWVFLFGYYEGYRNGWRTGFDAMKKIHEEYKTEITASYERTIAIFKSHVGLGEKPKKPDLPS